MTLTNFRKGVVNCLVGLHLIWISKLSMLTC
jgi:hypothetical protein